jgi:hypothetical protein
VNSRPKLSAANSLVFALLFALSLCTTSAERNKLKASDFEPLTELPWKKADATMESV